MFSSSGIDTPDAESANGRPRNRRRPNAAASNGAAAAPAADQGYGSSSLLGWAGASVGSSLNSVRSRSEGQNGGSLLSPSSGWVPNWSSIQELATSLLATTIDTDGPGSGSGARSRSPGGRRPERKAAAAAARKKLDTWGPVPPGESSASASASASSRPRIQDVAAGPTKAREAELRARKTASVLESHPGVNGGLDVRGKYKRRNSEDDSAAAAAAGAAAAQETEDCLVYIHHVKPVDTYFGIVLKYRCREDAFRRANGLWNRDNIQVRKWVALPVDMCEIKGRPCDDPSLVSGGADLLGSTPSAQGGPGSAGLAGVGGGDYFTLSTAGVLDPTNSGTLSKSTTSTSVAEDAAAAAAAEPLWTHVRWVRLESCPDPVEIARISRNSLGFFPPRRKKSLHSTISTVSTPRQSLDKPISDRAGLESPNRAASSRAPSLLGNRSALGTSPLSSSSPSRSAGTSSAATAAEDARPSWMRRPGGVGSMSRSVRAPGPARDSLNKWTTKHLPGLNIETLPSMSIMGSETARFGFSKSGNEAPGLVESSFEEGRDLTSSSRQDSGLDKAAASIEMWLRGAFAKRPGTPNAAGIASVSSSYGSSRPGLRVLEETLGDLIELEDGPIEDGRPGLGGRTSTSTTPTKSSDHNHNHNHNRSSSSNNSMNMNNTASGWRTDGDGSLRGRSTVASASRTSLAKGKKSD